MANVPIGFTGDASKVLREQEKIIRKHERMISKLQSANQKSEEGAKRAAKSVKGVGDAGERAFGGQAQSRLGAFAAKIGVMAAAAAGVKKLLTDINEQSKRAGQRGLAAESGLSQLAQLAGGDRARLSRLMGAARRTYGEGGAESLDAAARQIFALESAGALRDRRFFGRLHGIVDDPAGMARAAATMRKSVGARETGGMSDIVSKAFAASKYSPASAEALLTAAARGGQGIRAIGGTDEQLLAATAIMATARGSAEEGGTTVAALLKQLQKKGGFEGLGLVGSLEKLKSRGLSGRRLLKFLGGRQEASIAADVLMRNIPELQEITGAQAEAERTGLAQRIIQSKELMPELMAAREKRAAQARLEIERTRRGVAENLRQSYVKRKVRAAEAAGGPVAGSLQEWVYDASSYFYTNEGFVKEFFPEQLGEYQTQLGEQTRVMGQGGARFDVQITPKPDDPNAGAE